jgi:hypothetical protein
LRLVVLIGRLQDLSVGFTKATEISIFIRFMKPASVNHDPNPHPLGKKMVLPGTRRARDRILQMP